MYCTLNPLGNNKWAVVKIEMKLNALHCHWKWSKTLLCGNYKLTSPDSWKNKDTDTEFLIVELKTEGANRRHGNLDLLKRKNFNYT